MLLPVIRSSLKGCVSKHSPLTRIGLKRFFGSTTLQSPVEDLTDPKIAYRKFEKASLDRKSESYGMVTTVTRTSMEVQMCKKSMVELGYFKDPFLECFVKENHTEKFDAGRRILYWMRLLSMRSMQEEFLRTYKQEESLGPVQIINLGCGFDSTAFNLLNNSKEYAPFSYYEIDLPEVAETKAELIRSNHKLRNLLTGMDRDQSQKHMLKSDRYALTSCDITDFKRLHEVLLSMGVDPSKPTLVTTEYVLAYIETSQVEALIDYFSVHFRNITFVDFCFSNFLTEFGQKELDFFVKRGIPFKAHSHYLTPEIACQTYRKQGFKSENLSMDHIFKSCISQRERTRINSIEAYEDIQDYFKQKMRHSYVYLSQKLHAAPRHELSLSAAFRRH